MRDSTDIANAIEQVNGIVATQNAALQSVKTALEGKAAGGGTDISLGVTGASVGDIVKVKAVDENGKPTEWEAADYVDTRWKHVIDITTTEEIVGLEISQDKNGMSFDVLKYNEIWVIAKMVGVDGNTHNWWTINGYTDVNNVFSTAACSGGTTGTAYCSFYLFIRGNKLYSNDAGRKDPYGTVGDGGNNWLGNLLDHYNSSYIKKIIFAADETKKIGIDTEIRVLGRRTE